MLCTLATLDDKKIASIQSLEKKIGKTIIAFSCRDLSASQLKDDELRQIQEFERKLGLTLVAVK